MVGAGGLGSGPLDVPIAVTAFNAETLRKAGISSLADVARRTPSFSFQEAQTTKQDLFLRGIGTARLDAAVADPSIGVYLDEIYIGRRGTAQPPMLDLQRVEVLRGPRGTLYGRNVVGGAIGMVTARPEWEPEGWLRLTAGRSDGHFSAPIHGLEGAITGPLSDRVAGRLAVFQHSHGGYSRNFGDPLDPAERRERLANQDTLAARGSLQIELSDVLDLLLVADYSYSESDGHCRHAALNPDLPPGPGEAPVAGSGLLPDNVRDCATPYQSFTERETWGLTGRFDWDLGWASLVYLSALRAGEGRDQFAQTGITSPPALTDSLVGHREDYRAMTQELRLISNPGGRVQWQAGLYFLNERTDAVHTNRANSFLNTGPGSLGDVLDGAWRYDQRGRSRNLAVFGEVALDLSEAVVLTLGGRYTEDRKRFDNAAVCEDFGPSGSILCVAPLGLAQDQFQIALAQTWREFTPRVLLEWRASETALLYASSTRGFKGGGWQSRPESADLSTRSYNPEYAWNHELGAKTDWFDRRLRANAALFRTDFKDLQVEVLDELGLNQVVSNAATAEITGLELELTAFLGADPEVWLTGSLLDPTYKEYGDNTGNTMQYTPKRMASVGFEYDLPLRSDHDLSLRVDYGWQGRKYWNPENTLQEDSFGILDGRLTWQPAACPQELALRGRNLTNQTHRLGAGSFLGDVFSRYNAPRSLGVEFSARF